MFCNSLNSKYYGFDAAHYERFAKNAMMWDFGLVKDFEMNVALC